MTKNNSISQYVHVILSNVVAQSALVSLSATIDQPRELVNRTSIPERLLRRC